MLPYKLFIWKTLERIFDTHFNFKSGLKDWLENFSQFLKVRKLLSIQMAEMNMTDLVEYNIYLTGWDTKLVRLCTHNMEDNLQLKSMQKLWRGGLYKEVKLRVNVWTVHQTKKCS